MPNFAFLPTFSPTNISRYMVCLQAHIMITFWYYILCVLQAQVETTGSYNTTIRQTTPLIQFKDASFFVKSSKTFTIYKLGSCTYIIVSLLCVQVHAYCTEVKSFSVKKTFTCRDGGEKSTETR